MTWSISTQLDLFEVKGHASHMAQEDKNIW